MTAEEKISIRSVTYVTGLVRNQCDRFVPNTIDSRLRGNDDMIKVPDIYNSKTLNKIAPFYNLEVY